MRVLITGVAGFIGFHVAKALAEAGHDVSGVDNLNGYYPVKLKHDRLAVLPSRMRFTQMDLVDHEAFLALAQEAAPDVVVHLAAQAGVRHSLIDPFAYVRANVTGHLSVLEACRRLEGLSHLVYASSSSVYAESDTPFRETQELADPVSLYAATKRSDELMSATYAHLYGLKQVGLRFFTVYGPYGRPDMAYWSFTEKMLKGEPITIFNHGKMRRDFTHIDDIVAGVTATIAQAPAFDDGERPHRVYNLGNNRPTELLHMVKVLEGAVGKAASLQFEGMQPGDVTATYADLTQARRDYAFAPVIPIEDGLPQFVDWFRAYHRL